MRLFLFGVLFFCWTHVMAQTEPEPTPSATQICTSSSFSADFISFVEKELTIDHVVTVEQEAASITIAIYRDVAAFLWWEQHNPEQAKGICTETTTLEPFCQCVKKNMEKVQRIAVWKDSQGAYRACIAKE